MKPWGSYNFIEVEIWYKSLQWNVGIWWSKELWISLIARFMGPTWRPPGSCWPQMGPMLAPWTLLSLSSGWDMLIPGWSVYIVQAEQWHSGKCLLFMPWMKWGWVKGSHTQRMTLWQTRYVLTGLHHCVGCRCPGAYITGHGSMKWGWMKRSYIQRMTLGQTWYLLTGLCHHYGCRWPGAR